eukprot:CAMPEP_0201527518 /NCGR_PEP_ID=MMETSP0161_2-20130828/35443_1 /ASSEMBLY_ACC=CAM_ASM_000251 /TAXON_ID=180227 /ORGANISM="Neoparamoeba aestuarina, Strain SoJaBio B1-5/56/2" /LENGTH=73 /DNA_ID=CAMNT_0047928377 /DNA_START=103 /DNA_END=321 /DNA_ORIENTATION=+
MADPNLVGVPHPDAQDAWKERMLTYGDMFCFEYSNLKDDYNFEEEEGMLRISFPSGPATLYLSESGNEGPGVW